MKEVTDATAAKGSEYSYHEYNSPSPSHYDGTYQELGTVQPGYISFYIRSGSTTTHDAYIVFTNSSGDDVIFFFARGSGVLYVNADVGGDDTYATQLTHGIILSLRTLISFQRLLTTTSMRS